MGGQGQVVGGRLQQGSQSRRPGALGAQHVEAPGSLGREDASARVGGSVAVPETLQAWLAPREENPQLGGQFTQGAWGARALHLQAVGSTRQGSPGSRAATSDLAPG